MAFGIPFNSLGAMMDNPETRGLFTGEAPPQGVTGFLGKQVTGEAPPQGVTGNNLSGMSAKQRTRYLDDKVASITRSQWQNFMDVYKPVRDDLLKQAMQTDFSVEGDEAGRDAAAGVRASQGMLARNLSRAGTSLSPEEAAAVRRRMNLDMTKSVGRAENTTRRTLSDSRTNLLAGLVGLGRQAATGAVGGLQSAANNAAATQMMLQQGAAQSKATNLSSATALASALIFAI